jgi:hypothetical protein
VEVTADDHLAADAAEVVLRRVARIERRGLVEVTSSVSKKAVSLLLKRTFAIGMLRVLSSVKIAQFCKLNCQIRNGDGSSSAPTHEVIDSLQRHGRNIILCQCCVVAPLAYSVGLQTELAGLEDLGFCEIDECTTQATIRHWALIVVGTAFDVALSSATKPALPLFDTASPRSQITQATVIARGTEDWFS